MGLFRTLKSVVVPKSKSGALPCLLASILTISSAANGQTLYAPQGGEYPVARLMVGDQVLPDASINKSGGYLVWQDNATDGDGFGISARRLTDNLLGSLAAFRVNEQAGGDQQNPKVELMTNGGAVFVWQSGQIGSQDIIARFVGPDGTFRTGDVRVNSFTENQQMNPSVAALANGTVVVTWSSYGQDGNMQGVFGQRLSDSGAKIGGEFQVNQYSPFNQRTPAVAGLSGERFVVAWVSEQKRFENSVDVYARIFGAPTEPAGSEFLVNAATNISANPSVSSLPDGGFTVGWSERDIAVRDNAWDVYVRRFSAAGQPGGAASKLNTHSRGNHYAPQIAGLAENQMVVWTSSGQDGSFEGVFGRFLGADGTPAGGEFQVNTYAGGPQIYPAVTSDGASQFLVVWSSFTGGQSSFDLFGQRFALSVLKPEAPFVSALSPNRLSVTWPEAGTNTVVGYELYINDNPTPTLVTGNMWSVGSLAPGSSHSFKLAYQFSGGSRSVLSAPTVGITWGSDENLDGLPDDWQNVRWGNDPNKWPDPKSDSDGDGSSNLHEFLAGTDPMDSGSVLRTRIDSTQQGSFLHWNSRPGFVYQVQVSTKLSQDWTDIGGPRFAVGVDDSMLINAVGDSVYYRVKRLR